MRKLLITSSVLIISILILTIFFLTTVGIKTNKFNSLISKEVKRFNPDLIFKANEVYLKLNLGERMLNIETKNPTIQIKDQILQLSILKVHLDFLKILSENKEKSLKEIIVITKENKIKTFTNFINSYDFKLARFFIFNQIKDGNIKIEAKILPKKIKENQYNFNLEGYVNKGKINLINKYNFKNINFNFYLKDNEANIENLSFKYDLIDFKSNKIKIDLQEKNYLIEGDLASNETEINSKNINQVLNREFFDDKLLNFKSKNNFKFNINNKGKIKDLDVYSKVYFDKLFTSKKLQKLIYLKKGIVESRFFKDTLDINIDSNYAFIDSNYKNTEQSDKIKILINKKPKKNIQGLINFKNKNNIINSKEFKKFINLNNNINIIDQDIVFSSSGDISFKFDNKYKVKNIEVKSQIDLDKLLIGYKSLRIKKYLPKYANKIKLLDSKINFEYRKGNFDFNIISKYLINNIEDNFKLNLKKNNDNFYFNSIFDFEKLKIKIDEIKYEKPKNTFSKLNVEGNYKLNNEVYFKKINYEEDKNVILLNGLLISKNDKIKNLDLLSLNYINKNKILNNIKFEKDQKNYLLSGSSFDGDEIVNNIINRKSNNSLVNLFYNFNSKIKININKFFIDKNHFIKNLNGIVGYKYNKILFAELKGFTGTNKKLILNIKQNSNKEKVTNLFIDKPEAFLKKYKFIKGFEGGSLSFDSIEMNNKSVSKLKIYDFKVKEVPVLAKLLTLASLQGIADLLTGEGIRFDELDIDYETSGNTTNINEMYSIGPSISILMSGYILKNELTSLKGTLVPATTINKSISKIPVLGSLLVGKKMGEGVFGVSFKIKGHPDKLKTRVNPIKTLTPRFITRTLERIKKLN